MDSTTTYTVIADFQRVLFFGADLALAVEKGLAAHAAGGVGTVVVFDDSSGRHTELNPRGEGATACVWLAPAADEKPAPRRSGPGRPRLGVVSREVSLLPRHWEWLAAQRGSISATLRRLVDEARTRTAGATARARAQDAVCTVLTTLGGDRPGYEAATRALYRGELDEVERQVAVWPGDLRAYIGRLLVPLRGQAEGAR